MKEITKTFSYDIMLPKQLDSCKPLFVDIETTGLSPDTSRAYLIGFIRPEGAKWKFTQLFAETPREERAILLRAAAFASRFDCLVHFNGNHFDLPYLHRRCLQYGIDDPFLSLRSFDLYTELRGCKSFLKLPNCRQKSMEAFLGLGREDMYDGGRLIEVYHDYVKAPDDEKLRLLLLHNEEDVADMPRLLPMLRYTQLMYGELIDVTGDISFDISDDELTIILPLSQELPKPASAELLRIKLIAKENMLMLKLPVTRGELKFFFSDYKNYYYLPDEGIAVHKSVSAYVDKNHREQATARNCYIKKDGIFIPVPATSSGHLFRKTYSGQTFREVDEELSSDISFWKNYAIELFRLLK